MNSFNSFQSVVTSLASSNPTISPIKVNVSTSALQRVSYNDKWLYTYTQTGSIIFSPAPNEPFPIDCLVIGGGGGGGTNHGGGGGAGQVKLETLYIAGSLDQIEIQVGNGGAAGISDPENSADNGFDSVVYSIRALGGGGGGGSGIAASNGGSGGGGNGRSLNGLNYLGGLPNTQSGVTSGFKGGNGAAPDTSDSGAGGGGGSGSEGLNCNINNTKIGGSGGSGTNLYAGWISAINNIMPIDWQFATSTGIIASGGSGGSWEQTTVTPSVAGGGGAGGTNNNSPVIPPTNAIQNTGSGGGGGGSGGQDGATGGSGLVIIAIDKQYIN